MFAHNLEGIAKDGIFIHKECGPEGCIQKVFSYSTSSPPSLTMPTTVYKDNMSTFPITKCFLAYSDARIGTTRRMQSQPKPWHIGIVPASVKTATVESAAGKSASHESTRVKSSDVS